MKLSITLLLLVSILGCTLTADDTKFPNPVPSQDIPEVVYKSKETKLSFDYRLDPYTELVEEIPTILFIIRDDYITIEQSVGVGEIGAHPYDFLPISIDTVYYDSTHFKVRLLVEEYDRLPDFMPRQHIFEFYKDFLVVNGKYMYCSFKSATHAVELIDRGILTERNPYVYTLPRMETLTKVSKRFKVPEDKIKLWNPHLKYGYTVGDQVKIHWYMP